MFTAPSELGIPVTNVRGFRNIVKEANARPFPSYVFPLYQNESSYKRFYVKMGLICIEMKEKQIFGGMVLHEDLS